VFSGTLNLLLLTYLYCFSVLRMPMQRDGSRVDWWRWR